MQVVTATGLPPARTTEPRRLVRRRWLFLVATAGTALAVQIALAAILGGDGLSVMDLAILAAFTLTLPWTVIGFWNAITGLVLGLAHRDPVAAVLPIEGLDEVPGPMRGRTALVVPVYDEDPELVLRHLGATVDDLARSGGLDGFEVFLLSDTQDASSIVREAQAVEAFVAACGFADRFHYRRRAANLGFKTGNLWEWLERQGSAFDYMVVLDADSLMHGPVIRRLVHLMDRNPRLGILQTLITGLPSQSAFTRLFQFGMRHGMRTYTLGSAWWQGPAGPYWGHNAIVRVAPFMAHCRLPTLPGAPPLGGQVLSHDQLEAAAMQRGGYEVRVLPVEDGSYELNPPCLPEFTRRSLRWCQGNMQYLKLVGAPGWPPMARLQLALAILMYVAGSAWLAFMVLGFLQGALGIGGGILVADPWITAPSSFGFTLLLVMMTMTFAPKLAGLIDALVDGRRRRSYGGALPLLAGGFAEFVHGMMLAPIMAIAEAVFLAGLFFRGKGLAWKVQRRDGSGVGWREAATRFWPQTLVGAIIVAAFAAAAPQVLPWVLPAAIGPLLTIPFAWVTTRPALGRALARYRFAAIPEERATPVVVARALPWLAPPITPMPIAATALAGTSAAGGG